MVNNPDDFSFTDVNNSCLSNFSLVDFTFDDECENPDEFLWFDTVHPTTLAHEIIGEEALKTIQSKQSVPEPGTEVGVLAVGALYIANAIKHHQDNKKPNSII